MGKWIVILLLLAAAGGFLMMKVDCPVCNGSGQLEGTRTIQVKCHECGGSGKSDVQLKRETVRGGKARSIKRLGQKKVGGSCLKCGGKGYLEKKVPAGTCTRCGATGKIRPWEKWWQ